MTGRRGGLTLVETVVALTIAGMVATFAYAALSAGIDTDRRVGRAEALAADGTRWRALVTDALRHMTDAGQPGQPALSIGRDGMEFRTRAFGPSSGVGPAWQVRVSVQDSAAVLKATNEESGAELVARAHGVMAVRVSAQSRGVPEEWQRSWNSPSAPAAVRVEFGATAEHVMPPLLVAIGYRP